MPLEATEIASDLRCWDSEPQRGSPPADWWRRDTARDVPRLSAGLPAAQGERAENPPKRSGGCQRGTAAAVTAVVLLGLCVVVRDVGQRPTRRDILLAGPIIHSGGFSLRYSVLALGVFAWGVVLDVVRRIWRSVGFQRHRAPFPGCRPRTRAQQGPRTFRRGKAGRRPSFPQARDRPRGTARSLRCRPSMRGRKPRSEHTPEHWSSMRIRLGGKARNERSPARPRTCRGHTPGTRIALQTPRSDLRRRGHRKSNLVRPRSGRRRRARTPSRPLHLLPCRQSTGHMRRRPPRRRMSRVRTARTHAHLGFRLGTYA
ncbi:MAG: hypothetical protein ACI81R_001939 [Bradymonadia bacterium]|jgi:hypothetical protein